METIAKVGTIGRKEVGDGLFDRLLRVYPEGARGRRGEFFRAALSVDDARMRQVLDLLAAAGLKAGRDLGPSARDGREFGFELDRVYGPADLAEAELLELWPPGEACDYGAMHRAANGDMIIPELQMPDGFDIMFGLPCWYFVPEQVKQVLEGGGLSGVRFRTAFFHPRDLRLEDSHEDVLRRHGRPYWELDSDMTLPPLSPLMTFMDSDRRPVEPGDFSRGFHRREGIYMRPELHYRSSDLAALPPFDLARTFESFGNKPYRELDARPLVASRRFYEFCVANGLRTGWVPVRIDPL